MHGHDRGLVHPGVVKANFRGGTKPVFNLLASGWLDGLRGVAHMISGYRNSYGSTVRMP